MYDVVGVFTAGVLTASGPCAAPRFAAIAGLTSGKSAGEAVKLCTAFCSGLLLGYASFAVTAWVFQSALQHSHLLYAALACAFTAAALAPFLRRKCSHDRPAPSAASAGTALLLGASLALLVSPCCAPVIIAVTTYAAADGHGAHGALLLACYAAGHALPLLALAGVAQKCAAVFTAIATARATVLVTSGVLLALAGYYAVLA